MKRLVMVLVLLLLVSCGKKEEDVPVIIEETVKERMIMLDSTIYYDTGKVNSTIGRCGTMDGYINSSCKETEIPSVNNQSNFGKGYGYQIGFKDTIEVLIEGSWFIFSPNKEESILN